MNFFHYFLLILSEKIVKDVNVKFEKYNIYIISLTIKIVLLLLIIKSGKTFHLLSAWKQISS